MKNKTYQNAVEHLEFSNDLYKKVMENAQETKRHVRLLPALVAAVLITTVLATTVLADGEFLPAAPPKVEHTITVETLGTAKEEITDAKMLELTISKLTEGVTVNYMELDPIMHYSYFHGMLYSWKNGYQRITEDYEFEQVEMKQVDIYLDKNDITYKMRFTYLDTDEGVLSGQKYILQKNEYGEILLNPHSPSGGNWPVYLNVETGEYRDALPNYSAEDFGTTHVFAERLKGGLLLCTLVEDEPNSYNEYFWLGPDGTELKKLAIPKTGYEVVYNDALYYQNEKGHLYIMDEFFNFQLLTEYETFDDLSEGLLTVVTDDGKLGVYDIFTRETYVFPEIDVKKGDIDEVDGYNARRYGKDGKIALIFQWVNWDKFQAELQGIGILDPESGQLRMLEINNGYKCSGAYWLDENRLGVIYKTEDRQFFCIYEFD